LELFNLHQVYSSEDIRQSVNLILDSDSVAADVWGVEVLRCETSNERPNLATHYTVPVLREAALQLLTSTIYARNVEPARQIQVVSGVTTLGEKIYCETEIDDVLVKDASVEVILPFSAYGYCLITTNIENFALTVGAQCIWNTANDSQQIHLAIATRILEIRKEAGEIATFDSLPPFIVGSDFWESACRSNGGPNGSHAGTILDGCARLILDKPKNDVRPFGVVERARDGARAFRTHLTKSHEALRLMVWKCPTGVIELANVGPKHELAIIEGCVERSVAKSI
jgi:hypothetical protein